MFKSSIRPLISRATIQANYTNFGSLSIIDISKRNYAKALSKKKPRVNVMEKFPREFKKYNIYGIKTEDSNRPRPPMNFILPKIPKEFYKLRYFIFQLAQCRLTYDWESALQIARNIQRYEGEKGMPKKINPVVFNWICITLIRCGRPVEAIEIWRGMQNRDNGIFASSVRLLRKQRLSLK